MSCPCCQQPVDSFKDGQKCSSCGHFYRKSNVDYSHRAQRNPDLASLTKKNNQRLDDLVPYLKDKMRVFEFGCAEGSLGKLIKGRFDLTYHGLEVSLEKKHAQKYLDHVFSLFDEVENQKYDLVLCYHVLEHIEDIQGLARNLASFIDNTEGKIVIEVPNRSGTFFHAYDSNPEHIHQFTPTSLTHLLSRTGLEIELLKTGVYESGVYNDSIRVVVHRALTDNEKEEKFIANIHRKLPAPFYIWGSGGDFDNYLRPHLDKLKVKGIIDQGPARQGKKINNITIQPFDRKLASEYFLIATNVYKNEIRKELIENGAIPSKIVSIDELFERLP
ncbi:MAG: class I SAM-dependent methyltransferase [Bacteriovoracaceae bacterium]